MKDVVALISNLDFLEIPTSTENIVSEAVYSRLHRTTNSLLQKL